MIENLLAKADTILIGGAMAYTFFLAQGKTVGKSLSRKKQGGFGEESAGEGEREDCAAGGYGGGGDDDG